MMAQQSLNEEAAGRSIDFVIRSNALNVEGMVKSYGTFLQQLSQLNDEMMQFCAERLREDIEMPARIAQSRAPGDVAEVYAGFCKKMLDDYSEQAQRVMDLVSRMGWEPAPDEPVTEATEAPETDRKTAAKSDADETPVKPAKSSSQ